MRWRTNKRTGTKFRANSTNIRKKVKIMEVDPPYEFVISQKADQFTLDQAEKRIVELFSAIDRNLNNLDNVLQRLDVFILTNEEGWTPFVSVREWKEDGTISKELVHIPHDIKIDLIDSQIRYQSNLDASSLKNYLEYKAKQVTGGTPEMIQLSAGVQWPNLDKEYDYLDFIGRITMDCVNRAVENRVILFKRRLQELKEEKGLSGETNVSLEPKGVVNIGGNRIYLESWLNISETVGLEGFGAEV
jgi:hypothetical protein